MRIGRYEIAIFSDGRFRLDGGMMFGIVPKPLWERQVAPDALNRVTLEMNCLLVRDTVTGRSALVETGAGTKLTDKQKRNLGVDGPPKLLAELAARGVRAEDVSLVVNTHLHFDHAGGNTSLADGRPVATFPRASYVFQRWEWEDALATNERTRASYLPDDYAPLEAAGRLELVDGEAELLPGLRVERIPGHTRGTQVVRVSDGRTTLLFTSDFLPDRHHLPLAWTTALDLYPLEVLAAKKSLIPRAAAEGWIVAFTHDRPRFGRIVPSEGRYIFSELAE